jgi:hypothetical protein
MSETYRVLSQGLVPDASPADALRDLAALFKCPPEQVKPLLGITVCVVKKGLTADAAARYQQAMLACGLRTMVESEAIPAPPPDRILPSSASNPGAMMLSQIRLAALYPLFNDPQFWVRQGITREAFLADTAHHLYKGDARAALVVDAAAGVVCAYSDDLDCVVLLQFDPALAMAHGWKDGTRLLSVNFYEPKEQTTATDLTPGPGVDTYWGNVAPLIADLLTDDTAALAAAKANILDAEWQRALEMGQQLWRARAVIPRDGRPLTSGRPSALKPALDQMPQEQDTAEPAAYFEIVKSVLVMLCGLAGAGWLITRIGGMDFGVLYLVACFGIVLFTGLGISAASSLLRKITQRGDRNP